jgi:signal transduction histidine kinase/ActR/RegA family two-component response regulator
MNILNIVTDNLNFPREYLRAALMVSLLSVWVLVGLFYYLNRYTKREYFTMWTASWLFYALWLTLSLRFQNSSPTGFVFLAAQWCAGICAVFLLWGTLRFLDLPVRQTLFGLFMLFLLVWTFVGPQLSADTLQIQLPVFILLGSGSIFAAVCFFRMRKKMPFVGAGMLSLGFLLWGFYLWTYPFSQQYDQLYSSGYFAAAVLQLFIAVSMIVLVLEEVRFKADAISVEVEVARVEKEALQTKVLSTEEKCRSLFEQVRETKGTQEAYDELRRTQHAVVQQERLRALGQMASGVAHDINNALSPIVAYSELLLQSLPDLSPASRRHLGFIQRSAEDIANIVARMRNFYRRRFDEELVEVDLNEITQEVIEMTRPRWRDLSQREGISINVQAECEANLPRLMSDAGELREALTNLIFNAVDALPHGGSITLSTRLLKGPAGNGPQSREDQIQVEVRDNGIGMDAKTRERCLEPFFSTKAQRGGTGLGLAMVYGVMQRHGGNIDIDSEPGKGTSMRLIFPLRRQAAMSTETQFSRAKSARSLRILCCDDEPMIRQLLTDCLSLQKHDVSVAEGGEQGLEMFRAALQSNQPYEVVITDLGMPGIDGQAVTRAIKAQSPQTPVVMMTGWGTLMKEDGETNLQADALLPKPPRINELNDLLLKITGRENR